MPGTIGHNIEKMLRGEKRDISLKILHQAGFDAPRSITIAPRPSLRFYPYNAELFKLWIAN